VYRLGLRLAALANPKARLWVDGRRNWAENLRKAMGSEKTPLVWMHCASLGEFEQGRPLLEFIRNNYPGYRILVSFFSPSGYEIRKGYAGADIICYLPLDGAKAAKKFIDIVEPDLVLWIRYEFWYYYLKQLKARKVPVLLVSALFRGSEPFFRWYGHLHRNMLGCFTQVFVQNNASVGQLSGIGFTTAIVSGDTRYDRVSAIAAQFRPLPEIEQFIAGLPTLVAGSTWPEDEEVLQKVFSAINDPSLKLIIAPHEINEKHLNDISILFPAAVRFSSLTKPGQEISNILIIDTSECFQDYTNMPASLMLEAGFPKMEYIMYWKQLFITKSYSLDRIITSIQKQSVL